MLRTPEDFQHEYRGCDVRFGRGEVDDLGRYLSERDLDSALVVCGSNVGANDDLMAPLSAGLDQVLADVFDETTPAKRVETAFDILDAAEAADADVLVGVGGGSSLDLARQASVLAEDGRSLAALRTAAHEGELSGLVGDDGAYPVVVVPTTFAGADVSAGGSVEVVAAEDSPTGQPIRVSGSAMPIAVVADPALYETTPAGVLARSAMNGVDKGIETPYARDADPVSDAAAVHGLRHLADSLPSVVADDPAPRATERAVVGSLLVQFDRKLSVIHAVGHGFARRYDVQQGAVHAAAAPHVLAYLFGEADAARDVLAAGFGVETGDRKSDGTDEDDDPVARDVDPVARDSDAVARDVVAAVTDLRDAMGLPARLRELPETREDDLRAVAEFVVDDPMMARAPTGVEWTVDNVEEMLRLAW